MMSDLLTWRSERVARPLIPNRGRVGSLSRAGFTITELVVVLTVIGLLAALAITAYNKLANDAKIAKSATMVATLATAKAMFAADKNTTQAQIAAFNGAPDSNFAMIAPYIRINGARPQSEADLLEMSGLPSNATINLGTVDDSSFGGTNTDQQPKVIGYGLAAGSPAPGG